MSTGMIISDLRVAVGERTILSQLSLSIAPGECVALVGPNGAGKSTLIRAMLGLLPAASGTVQWQGQDVRRMRGQDRAAAMAWLPQHGIISEAVPVLEFVKAARFRFSESRADSLAAASAALADVGAAHLASQAVSTLSGGELQRVMVATLVAQDAALFLLDEPANHLDPAQQTAFYGMLRAQREAGRGVLCITHDMNLLGHLAAAQGAPDGLGPDTVRVIGMADGQIAFDCALDDPGLTASLSTLFGLSLEAVQRGGRQYFLPGGTP